MPQELTEKYNKKQMDFIFSLLETGNIKLSSKLSNITEATVFKYLNAGMREDIKIIRAKLIEDNLNRLQLAISKAVDVLIETMDNIECPPSIRLNAAKITLENVLKVREQEQILDRIAVLEQKMSEGET